MNGGHMTADAIAARLEDVQWMAETGECLDGAARRLGLTRNALEKWLSRRDPDSLRVLIARQPRDHNRFVGSDISICDLTGLGTRRAAHRARQRARQEGVGAA